MHFQIIQWSFCCVDPVGPRLLRRGSNPYLEMSHFYVPKMWILKFWNFSRIPLNVECSFSAIWRYLLALEVFSIRKNEEKNDFPVQFKTAFYLSFADFRVFPRNSLRQVWLGHANNKNRSRANHYRQVAVWWPHVITQTLALEKSLKLERQKRKIL